MLPAQRLDVRAVAYPVEPLEHPRSVLPHRLAHLLEWKLDVVDLAPGDSRQDLRHLLTREFVRGYVQAPTDELLTVLQNHPCEGRYVRERDLLQRSRGRQRQIGRASCRERV